jgi:hypothetical protein
MTATPTHPCQHRDAPDAACRRKGPFQGQDAGEIERKRALRLADVGKYAPRYLNTFRQAYAGGSLRAAINAFCFHCIGYEADEVRRCTAVDCPLWGHRPRRERCRVKIANNSGRC